MSQAVKKYLDGMNLDIFKKILSYNLNVTNEKVLVIGDKGLDDNIASPLLSNAFKKAADEMGIKSDMVLQKVKNKGDSADEEVITKLKNLPKGSVIIMNVSERLGRLGPLGLSFRKFCKNQNHRFTSASSLGVVKNSQIKDILNSYDIDYKKISERAHKIKKIFDKANELHITTPKGTDLTFNIRGMKGIVSDGIYRKKGQGGNLPGSEVYLAPYKDEVNGTVVIDGSMRTRNGTTLVKKPFKMDIRQGVVMGLSDTEDSRILEETLRWAHKKAKYPWGVRRLAEFGIGLNPKAKVIGCTVIDEKTLNTGHVAIGSNYWFGGSVYAIIHLDQVFWKPTIKADGKLIKI